MNPTQKAVYELRRDLDRIVAHHPAWSQKPGNTLIGELVRYEPGQTLDGGKCLTAIIRDVVTHDLVAVWIIDSGLIDVFRSEKPKAGELVGIKSLPDPEGNNGRFYAIRVHRPSETVVPDAGSLYGDYGPPPGDGRPF